MYWPLHLSRFLLSLCSHRRLRRIQRKHRHPPQSRSREATHCSQTRGLLNTSPGPYRFSNCFLLAIHRAQVAGKLRSRPVRERMAYASVRSNPDRDGRHRLDSAVGKPDRGDSKGRCCLDSGWGEALARRDTKYIDDAHRNIGTAKRQSRRVDGEGKRRAIPQVITVLP